MIKKTDKVIIQIPKFNVTILRSITLKDKIRLVYPQFEEDSLVVNEGSDPPPSVT
jgi:hypothetical protein